MFHWINGLKICKKAFNIIFQNLPKKGYMKNFKTAENISKFPNYRLYSSKNFNMVKS